MIRQPKPHISVSFVNHIAEIPQAAWDALAMPLKTPFFEWEWLHSLEASGSATARTGWMPNHLVVWRDHMLIAAAPLYLKGHSYGEFVFDHEWAHLADRLGVQYYPKLVGMSPFTPAEGYRFLIAPQEDEEELTALMIATIDHFCGHNQISGCHFLYVDPDWMKQMENYGFLTWLNHNYVWTNLNFQTFDDYLAAFNANQRRNIKRERKAVENAGLRLQVHAGEDVSRSLYSQMYAFYSDTCDKFGWWGSKYLTKRFFEQLYPNYRHRTVFFAAYAEDDPQHPIGMSICFYKSDRLYGRYWGSKQELENLHFDACYYSPIEWAIANGIQIFDPGAGGRHKKRRGFPATPNYSLHRFYEPRLGQILKRYIEQYNQMEQEQMAMINQDLPFKQASE